MDQQSNLDAYSTFLVFRLLESAAAFFSTNPN